MKKLLTAFLAAASLAVTAEMKIGTIDMVDLVRLHPHHESNRALVKSTDGDYKDKLAVQQDALKKLADDGKKAFEEMSNPMLSASAKAAAQKKVEAIQQKIIAGQQELRSAAQHYQNELADLEQRLIKIETDDIRAKVAKYAKANGYDLIADSSMLAFVKDSYDVTDEILKIMNVDPAKRKELKASDKKRK
jgi:Skp family chaperone for outer membrane proteins